MTALVADDEDPLKELFSNLLILVGYSEIVAVPDGEQALRYFNANPPPHLLLTDMRMSKMGGGELLESLVRR